MPLLVVVAGPNGSGKTTLVRQGVLEQVLRPPWTGRDEGDGGGPRGGEAPPMIEINPDDVAKALAGGEQPTPEQSLRAARICDDRLDAAIAAGRSVLVETVLSSDKLQRRVLAAKAAGYAVALVYVTLRHEALNVARVALRHAQGGHGVPPDRVLDRRARSHARFAWFAERADFVAVFENSAEPVCAAMKRGRRWRLWRPDLLPPDLAAAVEAAAGPGPRP
jgi:predicted ABC-type ATPase